MEQKISCNCGCSNTELLSTSCTLAIASIPIQTWEKLYSPEEALCEGTVFPSLNLPFFVTEKCTNN